jgi:hypothetical protein
MRAMRAVDDMQDPGVVALRGETGLFGEPLERAQRGTISPRKGEMPLPIAHHRLRHGDPQGFVRGPRSPSAVASPRDADRPATHLRSRARHAVRRMGNSGGIFATAREVVQVDLPSAGGAASPFE